MLIAEMESLAELRAVGASEFLHHSGCRDSKGSKAKEQGALTVAVFRQGRDDNILH